MERTNSKGPVFDVLIKKSNIYPPWVHLYLDTGNGPHDIKADHNKQLPVEPYEGGVEEGHGRGKRLDKLEDAKSWGRISIPDSSKDRGHLGVKYQ